MDFDQSIQEIILKASELAMKHRCEYISSLDLLRALVEVNLDVQQVFKELNINEEEFFSFLDKKQVTGEFPVDKEAVLSRISQEALFLAKQESVHYQFKETEPLFILFGFLHLTDTMVYQVLTKFAPKYGWFDAIHVQLLRRNEGNREQLLEYTPDLHPMDEDEEEFEDEFFAEPMPLETKELDQVSRNLTELARNGKLDPVIGRDEEIDRVLQILARRTKNNPLLLGDPGVGKTAIAEGIALRIANKEVPVEFQNKEIIQLDIANVVAGTRFRGDFEERMKKIMAEVEANPQIILFIDEIHMLMHAGSSEGSVDASNILKPALARGEIQILGATTFEEYQEKIEKDRAFARRFALVKLSEPTASETLTILEGLQGRYEAYHHLHFTKEALEAAVDLSDRYLTDRHFPDKAIDLLDEAAAKKRVIDRDYSFHEDQKASFDSFLEQQTEAMKKKDFVRAKELQDEMDSIKEELSSYEKDRQTKEIITKEDIAQVVSQWTGVPVTEVEQSEGQRLLHLEEELEKRVIGQKEACQVVARSIRRARSGLASSNRPIGSFLFLGPTGVGKTELAKTLARTLFGDEKQMIRIDMSEFMSKENVSRLIGSAPGYVGYESGGQLTEKVRQKPYSVLLFDEVEKAHPDVFNVMLQILDDGYVTDAKGRKVDFTNTVIIMTSNIGANEVRDQKRVGFGQSAELAQKERESIMKNALKEHFRPEFLNRIDDTIIFHNLAQKDIEAIAKLFVSDVKERVEKLGIELKVSHAVYEQLAKAGFDEEYGARPLRRVVIKEVEDRLADALLSKEFVAGDVVQFGVRQGKYYMKKK